MSGFSKEEMGNRLREVREAHGMTQEELAKKLLVTRTTIHNYETGYTTIKCEFLYDFAKLTGASIDYLICGDGFNMFDDHLQKHSQKVQNFVTYMIERLQCDFNIS